MRVVSLCEFLAGNPRSPDHWTAFKFIRAIKAEEFTQYANVPVGSQQRRLTMENRDEALGWAAELLCPLIVEASRSAAAGQILLVPVPGSTCISPDDVRSSRVFSIASQAAKLLGSAYQADPLLWWETVQASSHKQGGSRDAQELASNLQVRSGAGEHGQVIVIDDVLTTGAHLRASAAVLTSAGWSVLDPVVVVGRTVWLEQGADRNPSDKAFSHAEDVYADLQLMDPDEPWPGDDF